MSEGRAGRDLGPGILETSLILGLAALLTIVIIAFFGGPLSDIIALVVDAAKGDR